MFHGRDVLTSKTAKALLEIAKELDIKGRHAMKKADLVEAILEKTTAKPAPIVADKKSQKEEYLRNATLGALIAFKVNDKKALSGKIVEINEFGFVAKTKNGIKFNVLKHHVLWVKTGDRWPKGVYLALKGEKPCGVNSTAKAAN